MQQIKTEIRIPQTELEDSILNVLQLRALKEEIEQLEDIERTKIFNFFASMQTNEYTTPEGIKALKVTAMRWDEKLLNKILSPREWLRVTVEVRKLDKDKLDREVFNKEISQEKVLPAQKFIDQLRITFTLPVRIPKLDLGEKFLKIWRGGK